MAALVAASGTWAAGGHYAVDDAAILEPGTCEVESWLTRSRGGERLVHAGTGCRMGPVELGAAAQYARWSDSSQTSYSLQGKWAREWAADFSAGVSLSSSWQAHERPRYQATTLAGLVTWAARDDFALHLNLGRDFLRGTPDLGRRGVSAEWTPRAGWSAVGERYLEDGTHFLRAGLRWAVSDDWTVDLSHAHRLHGPGESSWTFGATRLIGRP